MFMPHDLLLEPGHSLSVEQDQGSLIRRTVLPGGVRVLTEHIPGMRSATVGAWVAVGSRDESPEHAGSTHFLEHLLFKGTKSREALDIAEAFDSVGAESNAITAKEYTCYYARVLDSDAAMATEVIWDMVTRARLDADDFATERGVILEELAMTDDDPTDVVHEKFARAVFGGHPLGRPIGGTPKIIRSVSVEAVREHYQRTYRPQTVVFTAAGAVDHDEVVAWVEKGLDAGGWVRDPQQPPVDRRNSNAVVEATSEPSVRIEREVEQAHIVLGGRGFKTTDERRPSIAVYNAILGAGMSSRLFQEIREKRGLAYTTYSFASPSAETGLFGTYAACALENADEVESLLSEAIDAMATQVTAEEVERAVGQICGATVLRLEDSYSRMARLGKSELNLGQLWSITEALDEIRRITAEDVMVLAQEYALQERVSVRLSR